MSFALIGIDLIAALILSLALYYRRHRRRDLVVAFLVVNIGVLSVATMLGSAEVAVGLGLGLFGVLSIIRLRSSEISQREVAYYFAALAIGLVAGLPATDLWLPVTFIALILVVMWGADHPRLLSRSRHQTLLVDRAIADEGELRAELTARLGAEEITALTVQHIDFVNDTTLVDARFRGAGCPSHRVGHRARDRRERPLMSASVLAEVLPLERFASIGLDALVAEAALLTRVDRKYVLPRADAAQVLAELGEGEGERILEIDGLRDFAYESVYFDTPDLLSFHMAAQPRRRRFKLRTRTYLDTAASFLEMKTRGARSATIKERIEYDLDERARLTDDGHDYAATALSAIGVAASRADDLTPNLTTRYRRATLLTADGSARATIDTGLEWQDADGAVLALPHLSIVETKSGARASHIDRALWRAGHRPATVSKYATGLAALRPDLPRNRWARLLRGSFASPICPTTTTTTATKPEEFPCIAAA